MENKYKILDETKKKEILERQQTKRMYTTVLPWIAIFSVLFMGLNKYVSGPLKKIVYLYDLVFHASTTLLGAYLILTTFPSVMDNIWEPGDPSSGWLIRQFAPMNVGYDTCAFFITLFRFPIQKDMLFHHLFAAGLCLFGMHGETYNAILLTVISHNISDVFLLGGKLLKHDGHPQWMSDLSMYCFVATWFFFRLYFLPVYLIWPLAVQNSVNAQGTIWAMGLVTITVLESLQIYWTFLIGRFVYRKVLLGQKISTGEDE